MKDRLRSFNNNEEIAKYLITKLSKKTGYLTSEDSNLSMFFKRKIHDALMELVSQRFINYSVELEDDMFFLLKNIKETDIKTALDFVDKFLTNYEED